MRYFLQVLLLVNKLLLFAVWSRRVDKVALLDILRILQVVLRGRGLEGISLLGHTPLIFLEGCHLVRIVWRQRSPLTVNLLHQTCWQWIITFMVLLMLMLEALASPELVVVLLYMFALVVRDKCGITMVVFIGVILESFLVELRFAQIYPIVV